MRCDMAGNKRGARAKFEIYMRAYVTVGVACLMGT